MSPRAPSQIRRPRAILFDYDGVLVASEPLHWAAWGSLLGALGIAYKKEEITALAGMTAPTIIRGLLAKHRPEWKPTDEELQQLALRKNDFYLQRVKTELTLYPGVREGLELLRRKGIAAAVVTNARRRELRTTIEMLGIKDCFQAVISREDVGISKPDPAPYLHAAATLGVAPDDCLAVEDSPTGLESALVAKIPTAAITTNFKVEELAQPVPGRPELKPLWILPSIAALFDRLRNYL